MHIFTIFSLIFNMFICIKKINTSAVPSFVDIFLRKKGNLQKTIEEFINKVF